MVAVTLVRVKALAVSRNRNSQWSAMHVRLYLSYLRLVVHGGCWGKCDPFLVPSTCNFNKPYPNGLYATNLRDGLFLIHPPTRD